MSKIKQAREALDDFNMRKKSGFDLTGFGQWVYMNEKTILTALNALERMQGVDLDILPTSIEIVTNHQAWRRGADIEMEDVKNLGIAIDDVLNAAQTLADIKKEVEG